MFTWDAEINGNEYFGMPSETLAEAEDRFASFMCNNYDHYSETRNRKIYGVFGSIMDKSKCVGGYDIYKIED